MSFVYDLRATLGFALLGALTLWSGIQRLLAGEPVERWLGTICLGVLWCTLVADGIQRRWRGDSRTRERGLDRRTTATMLVGFLALVPVGLWSRWQGHGPEAWGVLVGGGLFAAAVVAWQRRGLAE